jgi:hypothetical protein
MSESKDLLNAQFELADAIREHTGHFVEEEVAICAIIGALDRALGADQFRVLQYMIQREDAPEDPIEKAWVEARQAENDQRLMEFDRALQRR